MVPLKDNNPITTTPYINYGLIIINILIFIYQVSLTQQELQRFVRVAALVPCQLSATCPIGNQLIPEWLTLITSQFLHGGFLHLGGNMLFLAIFGNNIEDRLGHIKYLIFYLSCGVLAGLSQWFFSQNSTIPSLGASGAIAGVLGAYILRFPRTQILTLVPLGFFITTVRLPAYLFLGFWFFQQAFYSVASLQVRSNIGMESGGIAYWAHAGGFVFGAILAPIFGLYDKRH
ncbi:peptidase [Calothrix sp. NIES-4071]|nr:peptidase [Calothrix sp. NIES-4071]BAZ55236.1 peptidase [Calothrix sp. NIES-4105]